MKKVLLIGASIVQQSFAIEECGWGAGLSDWYSGFADVINRGYSGYNSTYIKQMMPHLFSYSNDVILAIIFIGSNDAISEQEKRHVPLSEYRSNLIEIILHLQTVYPNVVLLLVTPAIANVQFFPKHTIANLANYAAMVRDIGMEKCLSVVDLWAPNCNIELADLKDGLHFGQGANTKLLNELKRIIGLHHPEIVPSHSAQWV